MTSNPRSLRAQKHKQKQVRLQFQPLSSSSPVRDSYSTSIRDRLAKVGYDGAKLISEREPRKTENCTATVLPTPEPSSQPLDKSPSIISSPFTRLNHIRKSAEREQDLADVPTGETEEDEIVPPSSKRRRTHKTLLSDDNEDTTITRRSSRTIRSQRAVGTPTRSRDGLRPPTPRLSSPVRAIQDLGSSESSGEDGEVMSARPIQRKRTTLARRLDDAANLRDRRSTGFRSLVGNENEFVVDDDEADYRSSSMEQSPRRRPNRRKRAGRTKAEQDEIEDDLADLQDSDGVHDVDNRRTRGGPVQTQRNRTREHLEVLKRRRAGERAHRVVDSDEDEDEDDGASIDEIGDQGVESTQIQSIGGENSGFPSDEKPIEPPVRSGSGAEDDDFVVSDEAQDPDFHSRHGLHSAIPLAFTNFASRRPRELFVYVVEWLIKNKLAPAFTRDDEIYVLSWNKINDQIKAQAGSRLISAAWNEDFKNAILARPHMEFDHVGSDYEEFSLNCDACNRTNHPAVYRFTFFGHAYHKDSLEPIDEDADDEDRESEDEDEDRNDEMGESKTSHHASYDEAGHLLPSTRTTFNLGRFCAANAEMGHKLTHWKYNLNASLLGYLEEQGVLSATAIVAREKLSKRKREKEAESIVDMMDESGIISEMWKTLQADLEDARYGMEDHQGRNPRRKERIGKIRSKRADGQIEEWSERGKTTIVVGSDSE